MKKMNHLKSALDKEQTIVNEFDKSILKTDINDKIEHETTEKIREKFSDNNKLSRIFHNMSVLHDKDFYKKSLYSIPN